MRCTATMVRPPLVSPAKNSQFACQARHARSGATITPTMNTTSPTPKSALTAVLIHAGSSRFVAARASDADHSRGG
jgi:hypothetical protein